MGWTNTQPDILVLPNGATSGARVVIDGTRDAIFVYDATGALAESIAASPGTDDLGNSYRAGYTVYYASNKTFYNSEPTFVEVQNLAQDAAWQISSALPLGDFIFTSAGIAGLTQTAVQLAVNPSGTIVSWLMSNIIAFAPGGIGTFTAETWHNLSLTAGFQQLSGFGVPRYQLEPIAGGRTRLSGFLQLVGNQGQGTTVATLPAGYRPTVPRYFLTANNLSGGGGQVESVRVAANGVITTGEAGTGGNYIGLDGITFELD